MLRLTGTRTSQPSKPAAHLLPSRSLASASCFSRSSRRRGRSSFRSFSVLPAARAPSSSPARPCSTFSVATLQHEATNALDSSFCLPLCCFANHSSHCCGVLSNSRSHQDVATGRHGVITSQM